MAAPVPASSTSSNSGGTTTPTAYHCHVATQFQTVIQGYEDGTVSRDQCRVACDVFLAHEEEHRWWKAEAYLLLSHCNDNIFACIVHADKACRILEKVINAHGARAGEANLLHRVATARLLELKVQAYSQPLPEKTKSRCWHFKEWAKGVTQKMTRKVIRR